MTRTFASDPPDLAPPPPPDAATPADAGPPLASLRGEIDALDDAIHDLLIRRAEVVARLAQSRAKAEGPPLRPGREAQVLRRLLTRNRAPLPASAVMRFWRDLFAASTGLQAPFSAAVFAIGPEEMRIAREHFGALTPLRRVTTPSRALAQVASGEASVAVLPLPREDEPAEEAWWTGLDSPRLQVAARLPFWTPQAAAGGGTEAAQRGGCLVVAPGAPDPSGTDRSLLRLEGVGTGAGRGRASLQAALAASGLAQPEGGGILLLRRRDDGHGPAAAHALAEVEGVVALGDKRLASLPVERALPLGFYAVPMRGS
jgi:chorismate mutase / prephenate dehydratase